MSDMHTRRNPALFQTQVFTAAELIRNKILVHMQGYRQRAPHRIRVKKR